MRASRPTRDIAVVVLNNNCSAQGGASRVAIDEAVDLAAQGLDVTFIGATGPVCPELEAAPLRTICLNQLELVNAAGRPDVMLQGLWNMTAYRTTKRILERLDRRKTIVHMHGFTQALSTSAIQSALKMRFRVVYTMHDFFAACPAGGFFDYKESAPCYRKALSFDCVTTNCDKRNYLHKLYRVARSKIQIEMGGFPRHVMNYISLSRRSVEILRPYLPAEARIFSVPNPVLIDKSPPVEVQQNTSAAVIGRLDPEKGIKWVLEASRISGTPVTFVGDGPLRKDAEASSNCRVTGWVQRARVLAELETARYLIFPSLWFETYGLSVSEAAARGVPAIVSDVSAASERVRDNITGWHARAGDVMDLVRCLEIAKDDAAIRAAGRAGYEEWWSDPPTIRKHTNRLIEVYAEILELG
jgi:glycosyltransferase involved in cell wall biosynthesis